MELRFACPQCGAVNRRSDADQSTVLDCTECSYIGLLPLGWTSEGAVKRCPICGCDELFTQKDFHQRTAIIILLLGASFAIFTRFMSLAFAAIVCAFLYLNSRERLVCYQCRSQIAGHRRTRARRRFNASVAAALTTNTPREPRPRNSHREIL